MFQSFISNLKQSPNVKPKKIFFQMARLKCLQCILCILFHRENNLESPGLKQKRTKQKKINIFVALARNSSLFNMHHDFFLALFFQQFFTFIFLTFCVYPLSLYFLNLFFFHCFISSFVRSTIMLEEPFVNTVRHSTPGKGT